MKVHNVEQRSVEWMQLRAGIPTASEFDALLTPEFKIRTGQTPASYLAAKVAESWQDGPLASFNTFDMEMGSILEDKAIPFYELEYNTKIERVGFITTDDGRVGCSPDGLIGEDGGIEIKCPKVETHVKYLLDGELPKEYAAQVHGCMYVTGRKWWKFLSFRRRFPPLVITVERDDEIQNQIDAAVSQFLCKMDQAMKLMVKFNGGPRVQKMFVSFADRPSAKPEPEYEEVIP